MVMNTVCLGKPSYFGVKSMPPDEWYLRVQKGITAGLVPPTPSAIHILSKSEQDDFIKIISVVRPLGKPTRITAPTPAPSCKPVQMTLPLYPTPTPSSSSAVPIPPESIPILLATELHSLLKMLPTELPRGSEDIYSSDVGLIWRSRDLDWCNMSMAMVARGTPGTEGFDFDELALAIGLLGSAASVALDRAKNATNANRNIDEGELTEAEAINHLNSGIGIGGSGGYISLVKAKDEEKKMFKRVVEVIDTLLGIADGSIDPNSVVIVPYTEPEPPAVTPNPGEEGKGKDKDKDIAMDEDVKEVADVEMDVEVAETASTANTDATSPDQDTEAGGSSSGMTTRARGKARNGGGKAAKTSSRKTAAKEKSDKSAAGRTVKRRKGQ